MKFATSLLAASTAALAAAQDSSAVFYLTAKTSETTPISDMKIGVYEGTLAIGPTQNSSCTVPGTNYASFTKSDDGGLYLYTDNPPHQAYVDLTKEGLGHIYFSTGVQPIDSKYKRGPFEYIQGKLYFRDGDKDISWQACPLHGGEGYEVLLKPFDDLAGSSCIAFNAYPTQEEDPIKCLYGGFD